MIGFYKFTNLVGFLNKSSIRSLCAGDWYCKRIKAEEIPYGNNGIRLTVLIEVTDPPVDNRSVSDSVESFVSDRLDDFERRYPGVLAELSPQIDIVIKKQ